MVLFLSVLIAAILANLIGGWLFILCLPFYWIIDILIMFIDSDSE
jgi:hypothetical protein